MNKQELIKHFEELPYVSIHQMGKKSFIDLIEKLDEPQKPIVPQFVADWYEENKDNLEFNIFDYVYRFDQNAGLDFKDWFDDFNTKPIQTLVNMHQFGYEVEKEKRYLVKIIGITDYNSYLNYQKAEKAWTIESKMENDAIRTNHTRKDLEQDGFGWVFDCPGMEVEEVEE